MGLFGGRRHGSRDRSVIDAGWATAVGGRPDNQDRATTGPGWAIVSDGAGGHAGGARAAELTVAAVAAELADHGDRRDPEALLVRAFERANESVRRERDADPAVGRMAATLTVALAVPRGSRQRRWLVASLGDSPGWRVGPDGVQRITRDHTVAAELVRAGMLVEAEARAHPARHLITQAIGLDDAVRPDVGLVTLGPDDDLVLASDGIDVIEPSELVPLTRDAPTAADAARLLVQAAVRRHARDNVTVVVVRHGRGTRGQVP